MRREQFRRQAPASQPASCRAPPTKPGSRPRREEAIVPASCLEAFCPPRAKGRDQAVAAWAKPLT
eukprot:scaffold89667_cov26-Tisochrysis_lutea.AAC.1